MAFGSMSSAHQIMVLLTMRGVPGYVAQTRAARMETNAFSGALLRSSAAMNVATKRSWLHNQALFTARRYAFYATLAVTGLVFAIGRLGFQYVTTMQTARVALKPFFKENEEGMQNVINGLYKISTLSPFLFQDVMTSFRTMYPALKYAGVSAKTTTDLIQASTDAMAVSGKTSVGALTRVAIQWQHLANMGRPTGLVLNALARDGINVQGALRKELGITGESLASVAKSGITAKQVMDAVIRFYESKGSPFAGAAARQANETLQGSWMMFRDILSQAAGRGVGGLFGGLQQALKRVNEYLVPLFKANKPIGLYEIAAAIDHALSPNTHMILNLFVLFGAALKTVVFELGMLLGAIQFLLWPFDKLLNAINLGHGITKLFGFVLGTLVATFIVAKAALLPFLILFETWSIAVRVARAVAVSFQLIMLLANGNWAAATALISANTGATAANTAAAAANAEIMWTRDAATGALIATTGAATTATTAATGATIAWNASLVTLLGTIGLVIMGVGAMYWVARKYHIGLGVGAPAANVLPATREQRRRERQWDERQKHRSIWSRLFGGIVAGMPSFQHGGVSRGGVALVGEHGPEVVNLPSGARVTPITHAAAVGAGSMAIHVYPQDIYLDGRKMATVMATAITDKEARMRGRT